MDVPSQTSANGGGWSNVMAALIARFDATAAIFRAPPGIIADVTVR